jgi:hypothetical protein
VIFVDSSLQDVVMALKLFPVSSDNKGEPVRCMRFSCILRGVQGASAIAAAWLLVITSTTVLDIILNFTAINFISGLDDAAFCLAESGVFGPSMKDETKRIADAKLPACVYRKVKHVWYWVVMACTAVFLFALTMFVMVSQAKFDKWASTSLRVEFNDKEFGKYSGCYRINLRGAKYFKRHTYNHIHQNNSIGYCRDVRQWIIFDGIDDSFDPCDAKGEAVDRAYSSKTDAFDISTSFDDTWKASSGTPLDLYFFYSTEEIGSYCDIALGDDICDMEFNVPGYQHDSGDCCAATCTKLNCGGGGLTSAFGNFDFSGDWFPHCNDPEMVPMTIHLNGIASSVDPEISEFDPIWSDLYGFNETLWRARTPVDPLLILDCDGITVLIVYIDQTMVDNSETVMVKDGTNCKLLLRNTTSFNAPAPAFDDPIWLINYTIFHGENNNKEVESISQPSWENNIAVFKRIPQCYFRKFGNYTDIASLYPAIGPSNEAVDWMVEVDPENLLCEEHMFMERYVLTNFFAMNGTERFINKEHQCRWKPIICSNGQVKTINLEETGLRGYIPS